MVHWSWSDQDQPGDDRVLFFIKNVLFVTMMFVENEVQFTDQGVSKT